MKVLKLNQAIVEAKISTKNKFAQNWSALYSLLKFNFNNVKIIKIIAEITIIG
ncbi:hypothetical protein [Mycoplasmopsis anatis]|uniref:hypothetical protein n=1 Tax=Mycoplasmopsis anatis TaxID=171279 RepID=UPI001C4E09AE|nr:hypothetical protein [Mycoplasmopsis anatis]